MTAIAAAHRASSTPRAHSHLLSTAELAKSFKAATKGLQFGSESNYPFELSAAKDNGKGVTSSNVMDLFFKGIKHNVFSNPREARGLGIEKYEAGRMRSFVKNLGMEVPGNPQGTAANKKKNMAINLFINNLSDVSMFKIGPRDPDTKGKVLENQGLYAYVIAGKTKDGDIAATYFGSVET